jgi:hypothetical protein
MNMAAHADKRHLAKFTVAESPRACPVASDITEVGVEERPLGVQTTVLGQHEVNEPANPGRPGDAKPQVSRWETAGLPKRLQEWEKHKPDVHYSGGAVMKVRTLIVGMLAMGLLVGVAGMAQVTQGSTAQFSVPTLIRLTLSTTTINFGTLTEADYDAGQKDLVAAQGIQIWSNRNWALTVAANAGTWTGPLGTAKPAADLLWRATTADGRVTSHVSTLTGLATGATQVAAGNRGGNVQLSMDFRVLVSWENDPAGDYSLGFTYTLTAP